VSPLFLSLLGLGATSLLLWLLRPHRFRRIGWLAALPPALIAAWIIGQLPHLAQGGEINAVIAWSPRLGLELALRLDGLSAFFGLIITIIGAGVALYTGYYFTDEPRQGFFYSLLFLFMASMLGLVWADNLIALFIFWEGTSVTSYLLIAFKYTDKAAQDGGRRALLITAGGGLAMLVGMVILGTQAGTYSISQLVATPGLAELPYATAALILILAGAFTKSAQFPFHFWLPGAMAAPTPASAYLHSATMVKAGVYLLARLHPGLDDHPLWFWALLLFGGATMFVGALHAIGQYDLKGLLAYATVSQLGVFVMLLAFADEVAYTAAIVGILAHALYKGPLFLVAGIVDHATGTRDLRRLANLRRELPLVTVAAILAALSMAGTPPFFGYVAKELLIEEFIHAADVGQTLVGWGGLIVAALAAALGVGAAYILLWEAFLRSRADGDHPAHVHHAPPLSLVLPPLLLTLLGTAIPFFFPTIETLLFDAPISAVAGAETHVHLALWHGVNLVFLTSLAAIALGFGIALARRPLRRLLAAWPAWLDGTKLWDRFIYNVYDLAAWTTRTIQGGTLAQQATITLGAAVVVVIAALGMVNWPADFPVDWGHLPTLPEVILVALAVLAALITVRTQSRLGAIISIGVVGVAVTLFFVFYSAPDLALTQLLVDVLTLVLLVLVFYRMPPSKLPPIPTGWKVRNLLISSLMGLVGFTLVMFSAGTPFAPSIADYFLLNSVPLGHGANIVNVILVDFRGFDTLGEITVLGIAAVAGYSVFRAGLFRSRPPVSIPGDPEDRADKE
jgi:multicomponent Na+:H+ antiporter subunit A